MCSCAFSRSSLRSPSWSLLSSSLMAAILPWRTPMLQGSVAQSGVAGMTRTVADRMVESAGRGRVGREREIGALLAAATADEPPFLVAFVHGPGGIGKSHLVRRLLDALPAPVRGLYLDGRDVEPTPRGLRRALGQALGSTAADPDVGALARALAARPTVLVIDTYEGLGLLDAWLRTQFLPAMPATTLTVLAGRDRPATAWHTTAGWQGLVAEFPLAALSADEADQLLRRRGLDERQARWAASSRTATRWRWSSPPLPCAPIRGARKAGRWRPTASSKRSSGSSHPRPSPSSKPRRPSAGSPSPSSPRCSRRRRPAPPSTSSARCRSRSRPTTGCCCTTWSATPSATTWRCATPTGAAPTAAAPSPTSPSTGPVRPRTRGCARPTSCSSSRTRCSATRASPASGLRYWVEPATPRDRAAVFDIVARHESPTAAAVLGRWWERHAATFSVARGADGAVAAFVQIAELDQLGAALPADDPVADAWRAHLRDHPPAADDRVLVMRRWLGRQSGELRSPAVSACWLDVKRVYMQLRPRLRRIYSVVGDLPRLAPIFGPLGFAPTGEPVLVDGAPQQPVWLDFGPGSVDGWLAGLIGAETTETDDRTWRHTDRLGDRPLQP